MADTQQLRQTPVDNRYTNRDNVDTRDTYVEAGRPVAAAPPARASGQTILARIIWYIAGILLVLLAFRFVFALLGANPSNGFANFIYDASHPFVAPFFSLFGYNFQNGVSRFESYTLVAMAVYAIVAWGLARLATINRPRYDRA